ncbi:hypothetical protein [Silvanigrella aquatica]|uniref:Uncharacterized protein n=1 Tax=Silvanigrella aquatica TaxID=1915309 RepID=A0A1L4D087_9BACT|nr:hypothetical protein [Silvanigrella aquatica]APJ03604.1 hypothetical protein AXG55_06665 [Silvanigrella aquatica]
MKFRVHFFRHINPLFKTLGYSFFLILCTACSTLYSTNTPQSAIDDVKYQPVLEKWRKKVSAYKDLELKFTASAVLVSPEMEDSYRLRMLEIQGNQEQVDSKIILNKDTISVVVDLFTRSESYLDLDDKRFWNINLIINGKTINPLSVNRYRKPELLTPYFPKGSVWSRFYVVVFKLPVEILNGRNAKDLFELNEAKSQMPLGQDRTIIFSMNSSEAQAQFSWELSLIN